MDIKQLFIDGYLDRISRKFNVNKNTAFEFLSMAAITERPFQEVFSLYDDIQIRQKADLKGKDGGIDGAVFVEQGGYYTLMVFPCKNSPNFTRVGKISHFRLV